LVVAEFPRIELRGGNYTAIRVPSFFCGGPLMLRFRQLRPGGLRLSNLQQRGFEAGVFRLREADGSKTNYIAKTGKLVGAPLQILTI
jgi:hypothetical protein